MNSEIMKKRTSSIFADLDHKVDIAFRSQLIMAVYQSIPRNYDLGFYISEVEMHTLGYIYQKPGTTAKELAERTYRTKGTISTMLSHLEELGLLRQQIDPNSKRIHRLFVTEEGEEACKRHTNYDRKAISDFLIEMSKHCTPDEIDSFFKVLNFRSDYFESVIQKEREEYAIARKA